MIKDGYSLLLPSGFTDYFEIVRVEESPKDITIYLEEKLVLPSDSKDSHLESKGFVPAVGVQDFPVRGRGLLLNIRRRRWIDKETGGYVSRKIHIEADGTRLTQEFASFLKDYIDNHALSCNTVGDLYGIDGDLLERQYRNHLSGYKEWDQLSHVEDWILYPKNMGSYIGIDEVALSRGELYTVVINKEAKGKRVIDRFHVQKLAYDAVQEMRIKARWEALDQEAIAIHYAKAKGERYTAPVFENGDSLKQLLARSRYLLFKKESLWTTSQQQRAKILFREYPDIKKAYYLTMQLGLIYHQTKHADVALTKFARWYDQVDKSNFLAFGTIVRTIQTHYHEIVNFFLNRSTNAAAESFNAKIKAFRSQFRGVRDRTFFLYRLAKIYA